MFQIDESKYRVIDISAKVELGQGGDRPFEAKRSYLADMSYKFDITNTHTHVGTHVETAAHFFDDGASVDEYPLSAFYGRGVLLHVDLHGHKCIDADYIREQIGDILRDGDIVVCRNARADGATEKRWFTEDAAEYLRDRNAKMLVLGPNVGLGDSVESGRRFHGILMPKTTFLEIVENVEQISRTEFFVMALPFLVKGSDSGWCRAIVIEDR